MNKLSSLSTDKSCHLCTMLTQCNCCGDFTWGTTRAWPAIWLTLSDAGDSLSLYFSSWSSRSREIGKMQLIRSNHIGHCFGLSCTALRHGDINISCLLITSQSSCKRFLRIRLSPLRSVNAHCDVNCQLKLMDDWVREDSERVYPSFEASTTADNRSSHVCVCGQSARLNARKQRLTCLSTHWLICSVVGERAWDSYPQDLPLIFLSWNCIRTSRSSLITRCSIRPREYSSHMRSFTIMKMRVRFSFTLTYVTDDIHSLEWEAGISGEKLMHKLCGTITIATNSWIRISGNGHNDLCNSPRGNTCTLKRKRSSPSIELSVFFTRTLLKLETLVFIILVYFEKHYRHN